MKAFSGVHRLRLGRHADLGNRRLEVTMYIFEETAVPPKDQLRMSWFCHPSAVAAVKPTQARPSGSAAHRIGCLSQNQKAPASSALARVIRRTLPETLASPTKLSSSLDAKSSKWIWACARSVATVFAPMPKASVTTATAVKPGDLCNKRRAKRIS